MPTDCDRNPPTWRARTPALTGSRRLSGSPLPTGRDIAQMGSRGPPGTRLGSVSQSPPGRQRSALQPSGSTHQHLSSSPSHPVRRCLRTIQGSHPHGLRHVVGPTPRQPRATVSTTLVAGPAGSCQKPGRVGMDRVVRSRRRATASGRQRPPRLMEVVRLGRRWLPGARPAGNVDAVPTTVFFWGHAARSSHSRWTRNRDSVAGTHPLRLGTTQRRETTMARRFHRLHRSATARSPPVG